MAMTLESAIVELLGREMANAVFIQAQTIPDPNEKRIFLEELVGMLVDGNKEFTAGTKWLRKPVDPKTFILSDFYLGKSGEVYPEVLRHFIELNSGRYDEAVLTGGIGSAKTTLALYSQAYQLYLLSCLNNPQVTFGLDSASEIKVIFQSLRLGTAKAVDYNRFASMLGSSPYFREVFPFDKNLTSVLRFPHHIEIEPMSGSESAAIGQNIIGGIIDEVNFMAVIENSKQSVDGGTYNQAVELYNSIARRRKSRFMVAGGGMPGLLCVVSSKRIPGEFTDKKMEEAKTNPRIYVYDKRVWDIKPDAFCGEKFRIFVGDEIRRPRVLTPNEVVPDEDQDLIDLIPVEFAQEFKDDITKAVRDIAGHSTLATTPFLPNSDKVTACFGKVRSVIKNEWVDFVAEKCAILPGRMKNLEYPRYAHLDLSVSGDSTGLVIGHVPKFTIMGADPDADPNGGGKGEPMPVIQIDCALEVRPPKGGEIEFYKIRELLYKLRELGMPIKWVSFDSYQSRDSIQILRQKGFAAGMLSMDTSRIPYDTLKQALYDGRVLLPEHYRLKKELLALEIDHKKNKIDHNAHNSKDISDALAGVVYGLSTRREVWSSHGILITQAFSQSLMKPQEAQKDGEGK